MVRRTLNRRTVLKGAAAASGVVFLPSLGFAADQPRRGGTLHVGQPYNPAAIDPMTGRNLPDLNVLYACYDGLIDFNPSTLELKPGLAKAWTFKDPKTLVLDLNDGIDFFARGAPEPAKIIDVPVWDVTLFDLLKAYGTHPGRRKEGMLRIAPLNLFSMDDALKRIGDMLGHVLDWTVLRNFLPEGMDTPIQRRAAMAATFAATLELARNGRIELRQEGTFAPIYLRRSNRRDDLEPAPAPDLQQG